MEDLAAPPKKIVIKEMEFHPAECKIKKGERVYWVNEDKGSEHTATAKDKSFHTGYLPEGWTSGQYSFSKTTEYFCKVHPEMKGKVVVE